MEFDLLEVVNDFLADSYVPVEIKPLAIVIEIFIVIGYVGILFGIYRILRVFKEEEDMDILIDKIVLVMGFVIGLTDLFENVSFVLINISTINNFPLPGIFWIC